MPTFKTVVIRKTRQKDDFTVEADTPKEAVDKLRKMCDDGLRLSSEVEEEIVIYLLGQVD